MAVETHWICDVCGKRAIQTAKTKDVNESLIRDWFCVRLSANRLNRSGRDDSIHEIGYACSVECFQTICSHLKEIAKKHFYRHPSLPT